MILAICTPLSSPERNPGRAPVDRLVGSSLPSQAAILVNGHPVQIGLSPMDRHIDGIGGEGDADCAARDLLRASQASQQEAYEDRGCQCDLEEGVP